MKMIRMKFVDSIELFGNPTRHESDILKFLPGLLLELVPSHVGQAPSQKSVALHVPVPQFNSICLHPKVQPKVHLEVHPKF